ncbi:MAG: PilZ domain-containing protein [Acidobacteria bacterium]|nr:PilZ domain-containing protein [Acidobacteriota bacterium]
MPESAENRTLHRYMVNLPVMVKWQTAESKGTFPAVVHDISEVGFMVVGDADVPPGAMLEFTVGMPAEIATKEEKQYHFRGKVVRLQKTAEGKTGFGASIQEYESVAEEPVAPEPVVKVAPEYLTRQQEEETQRRKRMRAALTSATSKVVMVLVAVILVLGALNFFFSKGGDPLQQQLTGGNPDARVWVHESTGLYYCPGAQSYGTSTGRFMSQRDAQLAYHRPALGKPCP